MLELGRAVRTVGPVRAVRSAAVVVAAGVLVAACAAPGTAGTEQTPISERNAEVSVPDSGYVGTLLDGVPRPALSLPTTTGARFDLEDRRGTEATVVFFGYTHCPDVCPTTMADLAVAYRQLPDAVRRDVTVVFVTEDPRRDTPAVLRRWLDGFDPAFVGLIGGGSATRSVLRQLHLPITEIDRDPRSPVRHPPGHRHRGHGDDYAVGHSGVVYVFGPDHRTLIYTGGQSPADYAGDLTRLVA